MQLAVEIQERKAEVESSFPVSRIDSSPPIALTEEEGNQSKWNEEAFLF